MPSRVRVEKLVILDELETRMRRTAARLSMLAADVTASVSAPNGAGVAAAHLAGASALSWHIAEIKPAADRLAEAVAALEPRPGMPAETTARLALAELERASTGDEKALERAAAWARRLSSPGGAEGAPEPGSLGALAALALAAAAAATGEARFREAAERELGHLPERDEDAVVAARALVALGGEGDLDRARGVCDRVGLGRTAAGPDRTDPVASAECAGLACDLFVVEGSVRHLDALERVVLNELLFEQTDGGGAAAGRTLDGAPGSVDDALGTPALASGLAAAARHVLSHDAEGRVVAGTPANAVAALRVGGKTEVRCIVSTQLPVRGWTKWAFEPVRAATAPSAIASTRRPARRQRVAVSAPEPAEAPAQPGEAAPATFSFLVRVPAWAGDSRDGPLVKVDKQKANVRRSGGFLCFEIPTDRATEVEVVLFIGPGVIDRQSPVSWAKEAALTYGPLVLTASAHLNPGENLSMPLRITSPVEELAATADIRRRMPVVETKALGGGGRVIPVLFSPLGEVGGMSEGLGGTRPVRCVAFRTWHRLAR